MQPSGYSQLLPAIPLRCVPARGPRWSGGAPPRLAQPSCCVPCAGALSIYSWASPRSVADLCHACSPLRSPFAVPPFRRLSVAFLAPYRLAFLYLEDLDADVRRAELCLLIAKSSGRRSRSRYFFVSCAQASAFAHRSDAHTSFYPNGNLTSLFPLGLHCLDQLLPDLQEPRRREPPD